MIIKIEYTSRLEAIKLARLVLNLNASQALDQFRTYRSEMTHKSVVCFKGELRDKAWAMTSGSRAWITTISADNGLLGYFIADREGVESAERTLAGERVG